MKEDTQIKWLIAIIILLCGMSILVSISVSEVSIKKQNEVIDSLQVEISKLHDKVFEIAVERKDTIVVDVKILPQSPTHIHIKQETIEKWL